MTPELLADAVGCTPELARLYAPHLAEACDEYEINTPARLAAFLAQVGHESGSFRHVREIWGPTPAQVKYEGRADLGNSRAGDGSRFRGRGLIQITGRANCAEMRDRLRKRGQAAPDFEADPEALEQPKWAVWSAAAFWDARGLNAKADAGDFRGITRRINGGFNGLEDREKRHARALAALSAETLKTLPSEPIPPIKLEASMPIPALLLPFVQVALTKAIPRLADVLGPDVDPAKAKTIEVVADVVKAATGAATVQEAVEKIAADPAAAQAATVAVESRWYEITEAGGGGIAGARAADKEHRASGESVWVSPSFWAAVGLLPLAYMVVAGVVFGIGPEWPAEVRAAIATAVVSLVVGGLCGYYFGAATTRNRGPAPLK